MDFGLPMPTANQTSLISRIAQCFNSGILKVKENRLPRGTTGRSFVPGGPCLDISAKPSVETPGYFQTPVSRSVAICVSGERRHPGRQLARARLLEAIERRERELQQEKRAAVSKARRRNSPRPPRLKKKILETKRKRSQLKKLRAKAIE